jgi:hypothetical protein
MLETHRQLSDIIFADNNIRIRSTGFLAVTRNSTEFVSTEGFRDEVGYLPIETTRKYSEDAFDDKRWPWAEFRVHM